MGETHKLKIFNLDALLPHKACMTSENKSGLAADHLRFIEKQFNRDIL